MSEKSPNGGSVNDAASNDQTGSTAAFSPGDLLASWAAETDTPETPPTIGSTAAAAAAAPALESKPVVSSSTTTSIKSRHRALKMGISLPVEVQHPTGTREQSQTVFVLARGAVISLTNAVIVGQNLTLKNLKNGKVVECRVLSVERGLKGTNQVELEFTQVIPEFWPVHFPSEDYGASESHGRPSQPASSVSPSMPSRTDRKPIVNAPAVKQPTTPVSPGLERPSVSSKPVELVPLAGSLAGQQKADLIPAVESSAARNKTPVPGTLSTSDVRGAGLAASSMDHKAAQRKTPVPGAHTVNDFRRAEAAPPVELKVRKTPVPGTFTTADVHAMELKGSGLDIKVRNTPVPLTGTHHANDFRTSELSVARAHTGTMYSPPQHRHATASSGGGMKWIMLCVVIVVIAAGALLAPKFLSHPGTTHTEGSAAQTEKLATAEPAGGPAETPQNLQTAARASQSDATVAETPKAEPKLEIKEAQAEPKSEPNTEPRSETKLSAPTPVHQATTKTTKPAEPEPQELAVVKQSAATAPSRRQAPATDEPPPAPGIPDTGSALVAESQPPSVLSGITPASPTVAPRTVSHIKAPRLLTATPPVYPPIAKQNRIQGDVTIDMDIDTNGNVTGEKVLSGPPFLQAAAKDAVHRWKYEPATLNDKPIPYHIQVKVHFALQ